MPAAYVQIVERNPFRPLLPDAGVPAQIPQRAGSGGEEEARPPFRLAGIVSVGGLRTASLEPKQGASAFFLSEGAERFGWRALEIDPGSETVDLAGPSGRVVRLTLAEGIRREGPESAVRRALLDIPEPVLPPTRAEVEASAPFDWRELDERVLENLARDAAAVIQAARPLDTNGPEGEFIEPATGPR